MLIEADLHNHTTFSDGTMTPTELVEWGLHNGLRTLGITDHDSIAGCSEAVTAGAKKGLQIVTGVEATVRFTRKLFTGSLHLLLYFPHRFLADQEFVADLTSILGRGRGDALFHQRIDSINRVFGPDSSEPLLPRPLTFEEVQTLGCNLTRRHLVKALESFLGITKRETINRIIGNDSPAYIPSGVDVADLRPLFTKYQRLLRVIAHPAAGSFPGESHYKEVLPSFDVVKQLLPEFLALGIDGFEIHYPGHTPEHQRELEALRVRLGLPLATGGSDCHDREVRPIAVAGVTMAVVDTMQQLFEAEDSKLAYRQRAAGIQF